VWKIAAGAVERDLARCTTVLASVLLDNLPGLPTIRYTARKGVSGST
jgi:hypothetical protein